MLPTKSLHPDYVRQCLRDENGHLFWLIRPREHFQNDWRWEYWNRAWPGKEAGGKIPAGKRSKPRWIITIDSVVYYRYRLTWAIHHGEWPALQVDHINRDPLDDRIENLRLGNGSQNLANIPLNPRNTSGFRGVSPRPGGRFAASIRVKGKLLYLGTFSTPEKAYQVYLAAAKEHFGEFANGG